MGIGAWELELGNWNLRLPLPLRPQARCLVSVTPGQEEGRPAMLRHAMLPLVLAAQVGGPAPAPGTIPFRVHPLDTSLCETAAVVDVNNDRRPDILACEYWYAAPDWTRHKVGDIPRASGYIDNFSDLPLGAGACVRAGGSQWRRPAGPDYRQAGAGAWAGGKRKRAAGALLV